jgi:hypothetical protein
MGGVDERVVGAERPAAVGLGTGVGPEAVREPVGLGAGPVAEVGIMFV